MSFLRDEDDSFGHSSEENAWCTKAWGMMHDETEWADENREASEWKLRLLKGATAEVEARWRDEQVSYVSHDPLLGRGEMALWNKLKPSPKVQDSLLLLNHKKLTVRQRDAVTRLWAGCVLTSNSWCCKRRMNAVWRKPTSSDAEKASAVMCPCGTGPQDSLHCLECMLPSMVELHDNVLAAAISSLNCSLEATASLPWSTRRHKRAQATLSLETWASLSRERQLELSLGAHAQGDKIGSDAHVCMVSACAAGWACVEDCWRSPSYRDEPI
jgi:hypothetical protein